MKQLVVLLVILMAGCAVQPRPPTIRGADLYAHVGELRTTGRAIVPSSQAPLEVRREQFLVDRTRDQVFVVEQVVAGCRGDDLDADPECTLALLRDQRFAVEDAPPTPRAPKDDGHDISDIDKARLVLAATGTALAVGAAKCNAFDGCRELLGVAAGVDALLLLVLFTGLH